MKTINLITHNPNKVREFKQLLEPDFKIEHLDYDYPELRSDSPQEIVEIAAKSLAEKLQKIVVVEDSGFFITALNDFPGTCTAYIHKRIGNKGIIKLMKNIKDKERTCYYISAIAYCEPGNKPISFLGKEQGKVSLRIAGKNGWGQDPIFIPRKFNNKLNHDNKTYGQLRNKDGKDTNPFREMAIKKLKGYLIDKKN